MLTQRRAAAVGSPGPTHRVGPRSLAWVALLAGSMLAFYVVAYPLRGVSVGIGSDTPFYTWWTRYAGVEGLGSVGRARPGIVGLLGALSGALGQQAAWVVAAIAPVLAATTALALGAFVEASIRRDRLAVGLVVVLGGAFLSLLVPGWVSTLAFGTLLLGSLACLAEGLETGSAPRLGGSVFLLGAAGVMHPLFLALAGFLLAGALVALTPSLRRDLALGVPFLRTPFGRILAVAAGAGALVAACVGAAAISAGPPPGGDISRDAAMRRIGLPHLVKDSFGVKLRADFPWYRALTVSALALTPLLRPLRSVALAGAWRRIRSREALFWGVVVAWILVTLGGVIALLAGLPVPGQRLAVFCLPVAILAGIGLANPHVRPSGRRGTALAVLLTGSLVFVGVAWLGWIRQQVLISPDGARQARLAAETLADTPEGTALAVVADSDWPKPGFEIVRFRNFLRAAVPGARVPAVHVFPGSVADLLTGRPTLTGNEEHDRLSRDALRELGPVLDRRAIVVALRWFDPIAVADLTRAGGQPIGTGAVALSMTAADSPAPDGGPDLTEPGRELFSPWLPVWLSPLLLTVLAGVGWPWVAILLAGASPRLRAMLAPAFGAAAVATAAIAVDAVGLRLAQGGAPVALVLAASGPSIALGVRWVQHRTGGRAEAG